MAFEHTGEAVFHLCRGLSRSDPDRAGDVGCAVKILSATIDQINAVRIDITIGRFVHFVMAMRAIWAGGRNGVKA